MKVNKPDGKTEVVEYDSLNEFYKYICDTPINEAFRWEKLSSVNASENFTQTKSFEEATKLFKEGWSDMSAKLTQRLKAVENTTQVKKKSVNQLSVSGYQAIVPIYLSNQPNSMLNKKMIAMKQKVITIDKSINYNARTSTDTIVEESVKAFMIVKKLEAQGYRVNLNVVLGSKESDMQIAVKIKIKDASEKLNISKMAFPMVHPSMLRRLLFRFIEVYPAITRSFTHGYGIPSKTDDLKTWFKNDYILPSFITVDVDKIKSLNDLK